MRPVTNRRGFVSVMAVVVVLVTETERRMVKNKEWKKV